MDMPRTLFALLAAGWAILASLAHADDRRVEVYALQHQTPDALVRPVEAILQAGETVQAFNNDLVVNASPRTHEEVRYLLGQLDLPPRNLLITVQDNTSGHSITDDSGISGGVRQGDVYVGTGQPIRRENGLILRHEGLQVHTNRTIRNNTGNNSQQVRAIEGHPAWITIGQSAPVRSYDRYGYPTTEYVDANQGFYVTARLVGSRVQLDISTSNDQFSNVRRGVIDTQRVQTTVSGAIGEWIELGSIETSAQGSESSYTSRGNTLGGSITGIAVRVVPTD